MRHIIPISGKDSLATAIVQKEYQPNLEYEYIFNQTGMELSEVYQWLDKASQYLNAPIVQTGKNLFEIIREEGILPAPKQRFCTRLSKIYPMEEYLTGECIVYYGLRYDEMAREGYRTNNKSIQITPAYPLRTLKIGLPGVWTILQQRDLLPPAFIWDEVLEKVKSKMGTYKSIIDTLYPWQYRDLFSWRKRQFNCYGCFYMSLYEFAGLWYYYPQEFKLMQELEEEVGGEGYTLKKDNPLKDIPKRYNEIVEKRVKAICRTLYDFAQGKMFEDLDELNIVSCGLFCGK